MNITYCYENRASLSFVTARVKKPHGYGRVLRDERGGFSAIREEVDRTEAERALIEVNTGIYCFKIADPFVDISKYGTAISKRNFI